MSIKWGKVFKNGPSKICGRHIWSILEYFVSNKNFTLYEPFQLYKLSSVTYIVTKQ